MSGPTLIIQADVPDIGSGNTARRRIAGLLDDRETVIVASYLAGDASASAELSFTLGEATKLCEDVLGGDHRAKTTPGLARKLSAFALVLFRVCNAANAFQHIERFHDERTGHPDDRAEAADDEHSA